MDEDDTQLVLFDDQGSGSASGSDRSDMLDDELLFADLDEETTLWELENEFIPDYLEACTKFEDGNLFDEQESSSSLVRIGRSQDRDQFSRNNQIVTQIEVIIERMIDSILDGSNSLSMMLKTRTVGSRRQTHSKKYAMKPSAPKSRAVRFPGTTAKEAWNFTVLLRILELVHAGLINNTTMTKRDLYYRHPDLFVKQSVVDRYIDDLAYTFGCTRAQLHVTAATKGLVAGDFRLIREDGKCLWGMSESEGLLVPTIHEGDVFDLDHVRWVLVIEKEATFHSLLSSKDWQQLGLHGIVLTAKGYPDLASRKFLRQLANHDGSIPTFALVDWDPDGLAIMSTYKHGSCQLAHENVAQSTTPTLCLPSLQWLGVQSQHIIKNLSASSGDEAEETMPLQGLMRLTARDRSRAKRMLEWDLCEPDGLEQHWRSELQKMLTLNIKFEMQILDEIGGGLVQWLAGELNQAMVASAMQDGVCKEEESMLF